MRRKTFTNFPGIFPNLYRCPVPRDCARVRAYKHPPPSAHRPVSWRVFPARLATLVTEKLVTTLHDILEPEPPPRFDVPDSLKFSILHDVACGLAYLHGHKPPIIDCHLSARNVLLNSGMVVKIADLGVARIATSLKVQTVTSAPGALVYMPPEAIQDDVKPSVKMDMFSFGVLSLFTLSQTAFANLRRQEWKNLRSHRVGVSR